MENDCKHTRTTWLGEEPRMSLVCDDCGAVLAESFEPKSTKDNLDQYLHQDCYGPDDFANERF